MLRIGKAKHHAKPRKPRQLGKERLNALSEGVFAVVMTLMLLSVIDDVTSEAFDVHHIARSLVTLWPKFVAFFISFFVVGALWIGDNVLLDDIRYVDVRYLWIKLLYLLTVTFMGFSATLIGEHPDHWLVESLYGLNMLAAYLTTWWSFRYAVKTGLMEKRMDNQVLLKLIWLRVWVGIAAYSIGPFFSIWNPMWSFVYFMALAVAFALVMLFSSFEWAPTADEEPAG